MNEENISQWLKGIPYEVAFWKSWYNDKHHIQKLYTWSFYGKECKLDNYDPVPLIQSKRNPKILDVGCALSYAFGNIFGGINHIVDYVDPLAGFYNEILRHARIDRPMIKYGMIESLSAFYPMNTVDFIHVRNALDHCANPMRGLYECLAVLRKGGVLYLNHFRNVAVNEGYMGISPVQPYGRKWPSDYMEQQPTHQRKRSAGQFCPCQLLSGRQRQNCSRDNQDGARARLLLFV